MACTTSIHHSQVLKKAVVDIGQLKFTISTTQSWMSKNSFNLNSVIGRCLKKTITGNGQDKAWKAHLTFELNFISLIIDYYSKLYSGIT